MPPPSSWNDNKTWHSWDDLNREPWNNEEENWFVQTKCAFFEAEASLLMKQLFCENISPRVVFQKNLQKVQWRQFWLRDLDTAEVLV